MLDRLKPDRVAQSLRYVKNRFIYAHGSDLQPMRWVYEAGMQVNALLPNALKTRFDLQLHPDDLRALPRRTFEKQVGLLIGPNNWAGQAHLWSKAAAGLVGVDAINVQFQHGSPIRHPAEVTFRQEVNDRSPLWSRRLDHWIDDNATHVLIESARPFLGNRYGRDLAKQVRSLQERGIKVGVLWHGTDVRSPVLHMREESHSYFASLPAEEIEAREKEVQARRALVDDLQVVEFVSTPSLLSHRPQATWLPQLVDRQKWERPTPTTSSSESEPPLVVHIPSHGWIKGTPAVDAAGAKLEAEGMIRYRSITGLHPSKMPQAIAEADIVVDQITEANYGSASIEAMHMGKPVVSGMNQRIQDRIKSQFGVEAPLVNATPESIEGVLRDLAGDAGRREQLGKEGIRFVDRAHQPERAAKILWEQFLSSA